MPLVRQEVYGRRAPEAPQASTRFPDKSRAFFPEAPSLGIPAIAGSFHRICRRQPFIGIRIAEAAEELLSEIKRDDRRRVAVPYSQANCSHIGHAMAGLRQPKCRKPATTACSVLTPPPLKSLPNRTLPNCVRQI